MPALSKDVVALGPELVALRRDLHRHPELAYREKRTSARIGELLKETGWTVRTGLGGGTGVIADAPGGTPRVMLRVDLDALPIQEESQAPYASLEPGIMHACGHDGHTAMGVIAARVLAARGVSGIRFVFQPAEEGEGGAQVMVKDGCMDGIQRVLGVHLWNEMPVGTLGVKSGPLMASVDRLRVVIHGRGGHGAQPHRTHDPVVAAAHVVTALQTIVSREVSPVHPAVVTIGSIRAGDAFNVIPDEAVLLGTIRAFDPALRASMPERVRRVADGVAAALGCRASVEVTAGNPAVINDAGIADVARRAAVAIVGAELVIEPEPTMGGEDMAIYFDHAPGCFVFVGSANAARGLDQPHHSPRFDFDEDALQIGAEFLVRAAEEALKDV
jgi:amidohydrolase